jgi:hypothetical protein
VILERLLIETDLRMVVLDPNSDFVRLGETRADADAALADRYREAAERVAVFSADSPGARRLRLWARDIDPAEQAALLRLDPIADREEYAVLAELLVSERPPELGSLTKSDRPEARRLGLRFSSLGVERFGVWARGEAGSLVDAVRDPGLRCVVVDLGSLPTRDEQSLVATAVLSDLWRRRQERNPILIDRRGPQRLSGGAAGPAHRAGSGACGSPPRAASSGSTCSCRHTSAKDPRERSLADGQPRTDATQLARGRRLCASRVLIRPTEPDRARSHVPKGGGPDRGEDLAPAPLLKFEARLSEEGGADVPATWAATH